MFSSEFREISKSNFFTEYLRATPSGLVLLYFPKPKKKEKLAISFFILKQYVKIILIMLVFVFSLFVYTVFKIEF